MTTEKPYVLKVVMSKKEQRAFQKLFKQSGMRSMAEYVRRVLFK